MATRFKFLPVFTNFTLLVYLIGLPLKLFAQIAKLIKSNIFALMKTIVKSEIMELEP